MVCIARRSKLAGAPVDKMSVVYSSKIIMQNRCSAKTVVFRSDVIGVFELCNTFDKPAACNTSYV